MSKRAYLRRRGAASAAPRILPAFFFVGVAACAGLGPEPFDDGPSGAPQKSERAAVTAPAIHDALADGEMEFRDGERRVRAVRSAPRSSGTALSPLMLRYGAGRPEVPALVGRGAIVELSERGADEGSLKEVFAELGVRPVRPLMRSAGLWLVEDVGDGDGLDVASRLSAELDVDGKARALDEPRIRYASPDLYLRHRALGDPFTPDDPRFPGQWFFKNLNMTEAWSYSKGDPSVTVVVTDSGCDMKHPDLAAKMDPGKDVADVDDDPSYVPGEADNGHGTACAGVIGAVTNNSAGVAGGCPECRLRCVRLLGDKALPISADVDSFTFALDTGAAVSSNSWGFADPIPVPKAVETAINTLFDTGRGGKGALVIFAAGNEARVVGDEEMLAVRGVLGIGAINNLDEETPFTNSGNSVDLVAPTGTLTTDISGAEGYDPGDYAATFGGTSSACPVAASIAALLVSAAPDKTSAELYDVLLKTARPAPFALPDASGHDPIFGFGIIDPVKALKTVLGVVDTPDAGAPEDAGPISTPPPEDSDDGCGCSVPGHRDSEVDEEGRRPASNASALLIAALAALHVARRRRA